MNQSEKSMRCPRFQSGAHVGLVSGIATSVGSGIVAGLSSGPLGVGVGATAGLLTGTWSGEKVTTGKRKLTDEEIEFADAVFRGTVDYSRVRITRDGMCSRLVLRKQFVIRSI